MDTDTNTKSQKTISIKDNEWIKALEKGEFKKSVKKEIPAFLVSSAQKRALRNSYGN